MIDNPRLSANHVPWRNVTEFFLVEQRRVDDYAYVQPHLLQPADDGGMEWIRQQDGFAWARPSFVLSDAGAQELLDQLWANGFRPRQKIDEASRIEAVMRHLNDMRAIAFDRLKVSPPNQQ